LGWRGYHGPAFFYLLSDFMSKLEMLPPSRSKASEGDETNRLHLILDFRNRAIATVPSDFFEGDSKPALELSQKEVASVREVFEKNKGIRHKTAKELNCTMEWLDRVISHYKLDL
jgi:hypothetical protein